MRSHPPTLLTHVRRMLASRQVKGPATWLIALSGGSDSMALLHALSVLAPKHQLRLFAHGVNHGLREEASAELDLAEEAARSLGVPFARTGLKIAKGGNLQARARTARYEALRAAAVEVGATAIATAHHASDRAETVLIRLLRGSGARGLGVLQAEEGDLVRPLIRASKADITAHLTRHRINYARDPSNDDVRFLRVRVRTELLPLLRSLNPRIEEHLCALADELAAEAWGPRLPFGRQAIADLEALWAGRSPRSEVSLPGGLVVRYDRAQALGVNSRRKTASSRNSS